MTQLPLPRRRVLFGLGVGLALPAVITAARAAQPIDAAGDFGLNGADPSDQSQRLQAALDAAASEGRALTLPGAGFHVQNLRFPSSAQVSGIVGKTILTGNGDMPVGTIDSANGLRLEGIVFEAKPPSTGALPQNLLDIRNSSALSLRQCWFRNTAANGIRLLGSEATIEDCEFENIADAAIHSQNGAGLLLRGNRIRKGGNGGIRIWRDAPGPDRSIITGNRVEQIDWTRGGNGQNGNGVSIFRADDVIVSDNHFEDCAFSGVRVNAGRNTQIRGNTCRNSGEVAIFSEFEFSGSVIADNIVDGAATGIVMTNLDSGGRLATCTGNIVRNITPRSATNPDTTPVGIFAEADAVIANNAVDNVPGIGIAAGYGPYRRNLVISNNVITNTETGIAVSVAAQETPGMVRVTGNLISGATRAIAGFEWEKPITSDLASDAAKFPGIAVEGNSVG